MFTCYFFGRLLKLRRKRNQGRLLLWFKQDTLSFPRPQHPAARRTCRQYDTLWQACQQFWTPRAPWHSGRAAIRSARFGDGQVQIIIIIIITICFHLYSWYLHLYGIQSVAYIRHLTIYCTCYVTVHVMLQLMLNICTLTLVLFEICVQCPVWLFAVFLYVVLSRFIIIIIIIIIIIVVVV